MPVPNVLTGAPARDDFSPLQAAIVGRLNSDAFFADVAVIEEETGTAETESGEALGLSGRLRKGGKVGACVIVMAPTRAPATPNVPGPVYAVEVLLRCLEQPKINAASEGTKKPAAKIGQYVEQLFHLWRAGPTLLVVKGGVPYADEQGSIGRDVTLGFELGLQPLPKCLPPRVIFDAPAGTVTMTCPTPGATIRFAVDAFPAATAEGYAGASIAAPGPGHVLNAVAYAAGMAASDVTEWREPAP